ncbi:putative peptide maturation dehydrogenase [Stenotrophomonas sp. YIM B06876]|uniref:putative peptide maturation dehydrogenase n=1 Tax=Stenotrophomonas sp. YIM B06876 TaxID=3060211 RepID=UPI00273985D6|nr:putative peptide maturation dehydrogenase [Stenotrophomonas sp. YIM B06876]
MRIRRCAILFLEPREEIGFELDSLLKGGDGIRTFSRWLALAPHLEREVEVDRIERELLGSVSASRWTERVWGSGQEAAAAQRLLQAGLLLSGDAAFERHAERDQAIREAHWWPLAAVAHRFGRWHGTDGVAALEASGLATATGLREKLGPPPPAVAERVPVHQRLPLPRLPADAYEALRTQRATCRNFDAARPLPLAHLVRMLQRVLAAQAQVRIDEDTVFLKRNVPSGGGLHPTAAYLLVQAVEELPAGLYHYHPVAHALEPLTEVAGGIADFAARITAGQHWFANAHVLVVLTSRYARSQWKYRQHAKAYRALVLDVGHISQALYDAATELGLAAFVTAAINEVDIEQGLGLDPLREGPIAICGFGWRAAQRQVTEFDPAAQVWTRAADATAPL